MANYKGFEDFDAYADFAAGEINAYQEFGYSYEEAEENFYRDEKDRLSRQHLPGQGCSVPGCNCPPSA